MKKSMVTLAFAIMFVLSPLAVFAAGKEAAPAGPTPDQALAMLKEGNARYMSGKLTSPNVSQARRDETKGGQHPFASILGCSDSRAPIELVFDRGIGDLFVIRVAGNVSDTDEIGTVEYGAGHLGTPLIVVLGHKKCGAVTAVVKGDKVGGSIPQLVDNIVPAAKRAKDKRLEGDDLINRAITENVLQSIADMLTRSEEIRHLVASGKVKVVGAVYDLADGKVEWMGEHPDQAKLLGGGHEGHAAHKH
ncbi:MAG: carbonic anhydrase [Nitrospinae bacterium]|nr:carbonic anhydrase [Nitrospinota bacterium]